MGTKTGTPGFDIDGKSYTYDVGDPNAPPAPGYPLTTDKGDMSVDENDPPKKDISKTTKKTLADYLGKKTQVNYYPVDGIASEKKITAPANQTPAIPSADQTTDNTAFFTKGKKTLSGTSSTSTLKGWMTGGKVEDKKYVPPDATVVKLKKGKELGAPPDGVNGNQLLPGVPDGSVDGTPVGTYTKSVLANNRFTSDSPYGNSENPTLYSPKFGRFTTKRMAQVGVALSVRASRELNSAKEGLNPSSGGTEAKAILPSFNQLGASKVELNILEAQDVLQSISSDEIPDQSLVSIADGSWGSLNNTYDTYSGLTSLGMIALSTALTAGVTLLFEGLGFLLSLVKGSPEPRKTSDGRFILGRSTVTKQSNPNAFPPSFPPDIGSLLGLRPTIHPFSDCLKKGTLAFFGIDDSGGLLGSVTSGLTASASAPGFNSVVARSIIRSITVVIESIKKVFQSGNLISGIKNLLSMIETLRSSKLISALNVFANLGDAVLNENEDENITDPGEPMRKSRIDVQSDSDPGLVVGKNRMGGKTERKLKLAWSSNRAPAMYLLPNATLALQSIADNLGSFQSGIASEDKDTRSRYFLLTEDASKKNGNRIPVGKGSDNDDEITLRNMERLLDAEYVPFYFHDIRTNEIIAFHAFLASLSDDYTANYDSSEGMGRVEPVRIYKNTTRKIGLSFYVASTSPADFKDMWVKINKLTTLVYPQYTEGRWLTDADNKYAFTQPFSQMISASPMIRIRLGDLLTTNYSRFALARLFGATLSGDQKPQFGGNALSLDGKAVGNMGDFINSARTSPSDKTWLVTPGNTYDASSDAGGISPSTPISSGGTPSAPAWKADGYADYIPVVIDSVDKDNPFIVIVKPSLPDSNFFSSQGITAPDRQKAIIDIVKDRFANDKDPINNIIDKKFRVKATDLRLTRDTFKKLLKDAGVDSSSFDDLAGFLDPEKNALVKSFKSAGGKGLAGFIDSINFDWYDKVSWDVTPGNKAPMMCKVTISFTPIHDISPGIDSQGYNRAPIYGVGYYAPGTDTDDKK